MNVTTCTIEVSRYDPEGDNKPYLQRFEVPYNDTTSVLDALNYVKEQLDSSLSYRWSCRMAICGSCGFMLNGVPKLGCNHFLRDYVAQASPADLDAGKPVLTIEPLDHFSVERDLLVNMDEFLQHLEAVQPYLIDDNSAAQATSSSLPSPSPAAGASTEPAPVVNRQTPAQLARYQQYANCINCGLCYAACPQFGMNSDYVGPAAIAIAHRYNLDSRDAGKAQRMNILNTPDGVWPCTFIGFCSEVCPKGVDPAAAINQNKVESSKSMLIQLFKGSAVGGSSGGARK